MVVIAGERTCVVRKVECFYGDIGRLTTALGDPLAY